MIVVNWWLNLDRVEQAAKTTELAKEPRILSETLRNNYDPSKPKAIGVLDTPDLRKKTATRITYSREERNGETSRMLQ